MSNLSYDVTWFLNKLHVLDSNTKAIKTIYKTLKRDSYWSYPRDKRHEFLRAIIDHHESNHKTYVNVMRGY